MTKKQKYIKTLSEIRDSYFKTLETSKKLDKFEEGDLIGKMRAYSNCIKLAEKIL